jgi:hypothetical protein
VTDYLDEIQARADAATAAAPTGAGWVAVWSDDLDHYTIYTDDDAFKDVCVITPDIPQVAHFIAHARTDVPRLVAFAKAVLALSHDPACHDDVECDCNVGNIRWLADQHLGGDR